jgi:hypothetical protein
MFGATTREMKRGLPEAFGRDARAVCPLKNALSSTNMVARESPSKALNLLAYQPPTRDHAAGRAHEARREVAHARN